MCVSGLGFVIIRPSTRQSRLVEQDFSCFFIYQLGLRSIKAASTCRVSLSISWSDFGMCVKCFSSDGNLLTDIDEEAALCCRHRRCETAYITSA